MQEFDDRPAAWSEERAAMFRNQSVVDRYHLRPPYPQSIIDALVALATDLPRAVLDVGTGTGELARRMVQAVDRVDAVDVSPAMLARAATLVNGDHPRLRWLLGAVEDVPLEPPYALITAGSSLHWLRWEAAFARFASVLSPRGVLAIVHRDLVAVPWRGQLHDLQQSFAWGRDGRRPQVLPELERRGLFRALGRREEGPIPFAQSVDDYVESLHSRSGLALERMAVADVAAFDRQARALVEPWSSNGLLQLAVMGSLVWGTPLAGG